MVKHTRGCTLLVLCVLLATPIALSAAQPPDLQADSNRAPASQLAGELVTLERVPAAESIRNVKLSQALSVPQSVELTPDSLVRLLATAKPLDASDPTVRDWSYAPWYRGTFSTPEGEYAFQLYLGGRGLLVTPEGKCGLIAFRPEPEAAGGQVNTDVQLERAVGDIELLLKAEHYRDMEHLPKKWRESLSPREQNELIAQLIRHLSSRRSLPLAADESVLVLPNVTLRSEQDLVHKTHVHRDITREAGRCAWAIEELLLYSIPRLPAEYPPEAREAASAEANRDVVGEDLAVTLVRGMPPAPPGWPGNLPVEGRLRLAAAVDIDARVLRELLTDPSERVRAAVAANASTDLASLSKLWHDADATVREASRANSARARSIILSQPPPWNGRSK